MNVIPIPAFSDNYIWAILDENKQVFDCVDPGEANPVLKFAKLHQLKLRSILLTHHHHDHIGGVGTLIDMYPNCTVYGPVDSRIPYVTHPVIADDVILIGEHQYKVLFNPGHTSTHISYFEHKQLWLFCGDTLFSAGCGRVFDGTLDELHQSMLLFKTLPLETKIFCAHEYTQNNLKFALYVEPKNGDIRTYLEYLNTSKRDCSLPSRLALELSINPFLRTDNSAIIEFALQHGARSSSSKDVFALLREQKNVFK